MRSLNTVLIVEDEPLVRELSAEQLEDAGYAVIEAGSALGALSILESGAAVGVLFTDVNMPGRIDGLALARLVHELWPDIRLVVTSGRGEVTQSDVPEKGRFISKPYSLREMGDLIDGLAKSRS